MASNERMVAALLRERAAYERVGRTDRVAAVNDSLKAHGYEEEDPQRTPPQGRSAKPQETVDAKAVREWAAKEGVEVPAKGRIPEAVVEQYRADQD